MSTAASMRTLVATKEASEVFFEQLRRARERVLLLDYDGTIAPFSAQRNRAFPYPTVPELLDCIISTCRTRVVVITGRAAREIPPLLGLNPCPEIWRTNGMERLQANGSYVVAHVSEDAQQALAEADAGLRDEGLSDLVEIKPGAIAVHWRGLSSARLNEAKTAAYRVLSPLALRSHLLLASEFDGGLELREPVCSKGDVVTSILSEHGSDIAVAFLGDDATDEDAFRALNGRGLTVLVRSMYRFTAAQMWIRPPEELVQFFTDWIRACGGDL
jgi:trehalose 6-phosphate phosphatase